MLAFVAVTGFLGAGKTTTLAAIARRLEQQGRRVAIITNDQGDDLVDTRVAGPAATGIGEVTGGCFCCRFDDLLEVIQSVVAASPVDTILAEAVGSCTDLQATVVRPMKQLYGDRFAVAPLVTVVDPQRYAEVRRSIALTDAESDMAYLYRQQLTEADVLAVNKSDLTAADDVVAELSEHYDGVVLRYSARTGDGLDELLAALERPGNSAVDLDVDYDRYAAAEAELAWLNHSYQLRLPAGVGSADWADTLLREISRRTADNGWTVGHVKVSVSSDDAISKLSLTTAGAEPQLDLRAAPLKTESTAIALVNARVACEPAELDEVLEAAVAVASRAAAAAPINAVAAFKPGYPRPVHRIRVAAG
ncbi:GTP-binding protein [Fodinicola acaciae]|uniref:GTP-binding protein n=1 Tax=Fodinicola acaciae TaxID=2681555 RepID=UPI0013D78059|nr:GTP-binding protein [Fodinicola acaciae]